VGTATLIFTICTNSMASAAIHRSSRQFGCLVLPSETPVTLLCLVARGLNATVHVSSTWWAVRG